MLKTLLFEKHQQINSPSMEGYEKCKSFLDQFETQVQTSLQEHPNHFRVIRIPIQSSCSVYIKQKLRQEQIDYVQHHFLREENETELVISFTKGTKPSIMFN